jgi:hyperosmotically inducible protein
MNRAYRVVGLIVLGIMFLTALAALAAGQAAQPASPASQPPADQQAGGAQGQVSSDTLSPEAQAKLVQQIRHQIGMLPYFGVFDNIAFRLQGRTVILEGQVQRASLKPDAERAVKKVEGVEKVVNNIEVLPPGPFDQQIRQAVYQAIYGYGPFLKYANQPIPPIRILVKNARVTLEGVVDTETDKGLCTLRANQVPSVLSVTNNLRVVSSQTKQKEKKPK